MRSAPTTAKRAAHRLWLAPFTCLLASCGGGDAGTDPAPDDGVYDPPAVTASAMTGSLNQARNLHTATLLQDGRVLVTGGYDGVGKLASCEIYDPETGSWSPTASMSEARILHTATLLADGRVFVTGGAGNDGKSVIWFELFDPATESWSEINYDYGPGEDTTRMTNSRYGHTATLLPDGRVMVAGGYCSYIHNANDLLGEYTRTYELYDPATNVCAVPARDYPYLRARRYCHSATLLPDGNVLLVGGFNNEDDYHPYTDVYHVEIDTCTAVAPMPVGRMWHSAHLLADGRVLVAGGTNSVTTCTRDCRIYDPATDAWSATGNMREVRACHVAADLADGRILVAGNMYSKTTEIYDPAAGTWTFSADLFEYRHLFTMTTFGNGVVLIAGGLDNEPGNDHYLASCELFVPVDPGRQARRVLTGPRSPCRAAGG